MKKTEVEMLKEMVAEQTKQLYELYKQVEKLNKELNDIKLPR
tara:strand:- start:558 stop:683 length:126 start_codon:yes stop_codon:yes gene_type:complete